MGAELSVGADLSCVRPISCGIESDEEAALLATLDQWYGIWGRGIALQNGEIMDELLPLLADVSGIRIRRDALHA